MLELEWKSKKIIQVLSNYSKKGKIDSLDMRELFLLFAIKRKLKLMSHIINSEDCAMEFTENNFVDVIENEAYDMAVLLIREYFLIINNKKAAISSLLINSYLLTNGQVDAKCFLMRRFIEYASFHSA
jgi:hypothetical protein